MTIKDFILAWPILRRQVKSLNLPWLENFAFHDNDPFRVLISCILSLRTQDKTTGKASLKLFKLASTPQTLSQLRAKTIQEAIYPVGFYRVKARRIKKISKEIAKRHGSNVPDTLEGLLSLEGVGRKTANLVLTLGYDKYGICVDTHVRIFFERYYAAQILEKTERLTRCLWPENMQTNFSFMFSMLDRQVLQKERGKEVSLIKQTIGRVILY
jgi:endonuclease-3